MTPEEKQMLNDLSTKMSKLMQDIQTLKDENLKKEAVDVFAQGLTFVGRTTDTTPAGTMIINTPQGPTKFLIA